MTCMVAPTQRRETSSIPCVCAYTVIAMTEPTWWTYFKGVAGTETGRAIAEAAGVSEPQVSRWKSGKNRPDADSLVRFARAYHRSPCRGARRSWLHQRHRSESRHRDSNLDRGSTHRRPARRDQTATRTRAHPENRRILQCPASRNHFPVVFVAIGNTERSERRPGGCSRQHLSLDCPQSRYRRCRRAVGLRPRRWRAPTKGTIGRAGGPRTTRPRRRASRRHKR